LSYTKYFYSLLLTLIVFSSCQPKIGFLNPEEIIADASLVDLESRNDLVAHCRSSDSYIP